MKKSSIELIAEALPLKARDQLMAELEERLAEVREEEALINRTLVILKGPQAKANLEGGERPKVKQPVVAPTAAVHMAQQGVLPLTATSTKVDKTAKDRKPKGAVIFGKMKDNVVIAFKAEPNLVVTSHEMAKRIAGNWGITSQTHVNWNNLVRSVSNCLNFYRVGNPNKQVELFERITDDAGNYHYSLAKKAEK